MLPESLPILFRSVRACAVGLLTWLALTCLSPAGGIAAGAPSPTETGIRVGDLAPGFSLTGVDGELVGLTGGPGERPSLVVFWSFFCFPCQKEIPGLQELYAELGREQLQLIGINLDGPAFAGKVRPFLDQNGITFPTAYDNLTKDFFEVAERYGVVGTPTSFLIDTQGRVRFIQLGRLDKDTLKGLVRGASDSAYCPELIKPRE